jgi:hypothetical protein
MSQMKSGEIQSNCANGLEPIPALRAGVTNDARRISCTEPKPISRSACVPQAVFCGT